MPPQAEGRFHGSDEVLRTYELPEGMRMMIEVDCEKVDIPDKPTGKIAHHWRTNRRPHHFHEQW